MVEKQNIDKLLLARLLENVMLTFSKKKNLRENEERKKIKKTNGQRKKEKMTLINKRERVEKSKKKKKLIIWVGLKIKFTVSLLYLQNFD